MRERRWLPQKESSSKGLARAEAGGAPAKSGLAWNATFSLEEEDEGAAAGAASGAQVLDPTLVADLNRCVQTLESALAASAASARLTHAAEADLSAAEVSAALQAAMASGAAATTTGQGGLPSDQGEEDGASPSAPASSAATAALLAKLQAAEQRASLEQALHSAQAEAAAAKEATKAAEDAVEVLRGEVKRLQHTAQGASAMGRLQDLCLQAEERAHSAERRASVADARCARAENGLKEANAAIKEREKSLSGAQADIKALQAKLAAAESQGCGGGGGGGAAASASHQEDMSKLEKQAAEAHEAQVMAELRVMDDVAAERDQLSAQVFALRERLNEMKSERGSAEHYKNVAESRTRDAEKQIGAEVEQRLSAACANRSLWPLPILSEVAKLEARLAALQNALSAAQSRMEADGQALQSEVRQRTELQQKTAHLEGALLRLEEAAAERAQEAQQNLARLNAQLADTQAEVAHLTAANEELAATAAEAKHQASRAHSAVLLPPPSHTLPGEGGNGKWQVRNAVGGGSLYGVADTQQLAQLRQASSVDQEELEGAPSEGGEGVLGGVDILYLKNVVLKFMEAVTAGRVAERDALLPAVATLLQATPQEFHTLQRVLQNTAPPSVQVLSALGIKLPGF
ncbi:hypothetical protein DUNSADRAFT_18709 [Dunaliella salina]|uniref:GRIP domain-containing protein n=1 Tax=Dunaliella salina TaxID=3046 RepID=A0ABQ7FZN3_DUNSA|nr:hypothetical protein DUNSADRAFT_18709 [Dunaliella salina]|eukprot:KAF5827804.1 hypothetical protein DUNSADRAFT_18709 [Dunaliella salina]